MRKIFLLTGLSLFILMPNIRAQESGLESGYERPHQQLIQGGFSFGYYGYGYVGNRVGFSLPLTASYEMFVGENLSAGGFFGYSSYRYEGVSDYRYRWTFLDFGARASYHYIPLLNELTDADIDQEKWDFYVSLMLIFERRSFNSSDQYYQDYYDNEFSTHLGTVAGFRYKFSNSLAIYFEGGRGTFGYGTLGVTLML
jgi:hypothetical protein